MAFYLSGAFTLAGWALYMRIAKADPIISFERECYARAYIAQGSRKPSPRFSSSSGGSAEEVGGSGATGGGSSGARRGTATSNA